ncbi:MAG: hypothetical protein KDJ38_04150 [Gammaproteobacteria bacterium]|nr:hypothetical protein [Gammaproteobacteria bacterium]
MSKLPDHESQVLAVHATFIHTVVFALLDPAKRPMLEQHLQTAEKNGWAALTGAIRKIMQGQTDNAVFAPLDEEDRIIVKSILKGLQNPQTLPPINDKPDPSAAAPGLAMLVRQAGGGDMNALQMLGAMAGQMAAAGGSMARLGAVLKQMLDGERDADKLSAGMDDKGRELVSKILAELDKNKLN